MRNLARIEIVEDIFPIPNADRIEVAQVLGWQVVVKKGDFKPKDLCIYIECDSILPDHPVFEFMRERKFKVKIIKLRKQISMGLVMPVSILKEFTNKQVDLTPGTSVADILGINKHDPEAEKEARRARVSSKKKLNPVTSYFMSFQWFRNLRYKLGYTRVRNFPHFISKTDEERIQNMPQVLQQWKDPFYIAEKIDGMSTTYAIYKDSDSWFKKSNFYVCSRNISLHRENSTPWWLAARKFDVEKKLRRVGNNIGIQGELVGPDIQGNIYNKDEIDFFVFNVVELDTGKKLRLKEKEEFCSLYGFKLVPVLNREIYLTDLTVEGLLKMATGKSVLHDTLREGIVLRSLYEDNKSFKVISPEFLLGVKDDN